MGHRFGMAAVACLLTGTGAVAQATGSGDGAIVVTAQRREQAATDVPVAVSALGADELARRGLTTLNGLQQAVPNLEIEPAFGSGQPQFRIRGVGFQDYATNNAPTVGVYVDEVAYPVPIMTQGLIFDVARVEVLRGPQGTLYGRNTTGGAVNIVTNRPGDHAEGGLLAEYGRFGAFSGQGFLSGPLGGGWGLRVAAALDQGGGFQHDRTTGVGLGDADRAGLRALLGYQGGAVTALLNGHAVADASENVGLRLLDPFQTSLRPGVPGPVIPADRDRRLTGWSISPALARDVDLPGDKPGRRNYGYGSSLDLGIDLGGVRLTSLSSYDRFVRREYGDYDASSSIEADVFFGSRVRVLAEELRLQSTGAGPVTWTAGAYLSEQRLHERYFSDFLDLLGTYARVRYGQRVRSVAGFGQAEVALTPRLGLTAGLRYERETRVLDGFGSAFGGATALPPTTARTRMRPLTGKLALQYKPAADLLVYLSASKGVKSGGFTTYNTGDASGIAPFRPERLYAYEVGAKLGGRGPIGFDIAAFLYDYRDQQVLDAVCGVNGPVGRFANAPRSRIWGLEASLRLRPARGLTLTPYASYKHGRYRDYQSLDLDACRATRATITVDRAGDRIPFPEVEAGGTAGWELPLGRFRLTPALTWSWRSRTYSWLGSRYDIPAYALLDAELALAPAAGPWRVALWGRNVTDTRYDLTRNFFTSANVAQPGRPASYGVRVGYRF